MGTPTSKRTVRAPVAGAHKKASPPGRTRLLVDERREQLLELGIRAFSERSYDEVQVEHLARAAGISKGLLYHYFPTKRGFYVAALDQASKRLLEVTLLPATSSVEVRLRAGLEAYLDFVREHGDAFIALMRGGVGSDAEVAAILERTRATFVDRICEGLPTGAATRTVRLALRGWIGFVEATSTEWLLRRNVPRERLVDLMAGVLVAALTLAGADVPLAAP